MRTRIMKAKAFSIFLRVRSGRRSRSSCRYMPWNFTSCASSSMMAPVISSRRPSASATRSESLASLMRSLRDNSSVIVSLSKTRVNALLGGSIGAGSICVLQIALFALQCHHRLLGRLGGQSVHVGKSAHQRGAHVLRHRLGIAAHIEISAAFEPFDQLGAAVPQFML